MENTATFIPKSLIDQTLLTPPKAGKWQLSPLKEVSFERGVPLHVLEDTDIANESEVHEDEADLWIGISGEVAFTVEGENYIVREGDVLYIPAGLAHSHTAKGTARLFIIKVPAR